MNTNPGKLEIPGLRDKVAVITGGGGAICGAIAPALAALGARVALWDLSEDAAKSKANEIETAGGEALAVRCNVTDRKEVDEATRTTVAAFETIDILINGAGGGRADATTSADLKFFDILPSDLHDTIALNYDSAVLPAQAVGRVFADKGEGVVLNIASIAGLKPLTRSLGYSNGKAAVVSFTEWLSVHMAQEYSPKIRVNAIAPGFIVTDQNRFILWDEKSGELSERGKEVVRNVPMMRLGRDEEMVGAALWLVSVAATFVTGAVVPIDGGYNAFSGV
ncbi:MAG: SDR family oxidoreductase [Planctomycetes bacterium]|nr:SDR family oxidoreductase [Planctomycetota bacterium]